MDQLKEYHDPDYPEAAVCVKEEPPSLSEEEKVKKIKSIIRREFTNELEAREKEVMLLDQRMMLSRRLLHRLRYSLVNSYYSDQKLQLNSAQIHDEIATQRDPRAKAQSVNILRDGQRHIHPSVQKLFGKKSVDIDEIFKTRVPRNKTRMDYSAMLKNRNSTTSADATKSLRPDDEPTTSQPTLPRKVPRHMEPKITNVVTLDEATRNQMKHRYRFIIGNTSKYVPAASRLDRSTHKWLLYIRGPPHAPDPSPLLTGVSVTLHHSYAPHHRVHLDKHPFHISRRGWGEFPAKIELQFTLPERNKPASLEHNIKLDRNYTGMQTLGSETIVDVWLYSTEEMLQYEFTDDTDKKIEVTVKTKPVKEEVTDSTDNTDNWMDFFKTPTELDVDEMFVKPTKPEVKQETDFEEKIDLISESILDMQNDIHIQDTHIEDTQKCIQNDQKNDTQKCVKNTHIQNTQNCVQNSVQCTQKSKNTQIINNTQSVNNTQSIKDTQNENILQVPSEILNQPSSVKKRIVKYIDPITGKIYYLEMDRELDLTKVQEIIINNTATKISPIKSNGLKNVRRRKGGMSLLKPEVKKQIKTENCIRIDRLRQNFPHLENDHCYLAYPKVNDIEKVEEMDFEVKKEETLYDSLVSVISRFTDVRSAVNHLVKRIPLISDEARDPDFLSSFPFVVESSERYWKLDFAKRRNIEWSRAKFINTLLTEHFKHGPIWRTKQILLYLRLHGHHPIRAEVAVKEDSDWSSWNEGCSIKEIYPNSEDISSLSVFKFDMDGSTETIELSDDEDIDVTSDTVKVNVKKEMASTSGLIPLPVASEDDRLRFMYIERKCADIGIELRNEDIGNGYSYSSVHAVLLSAMKSFAEELIRNALAEQRRQDNPRDAPSIWTGSGGLAVSLAAWWRGARGGRLRALARADLAAIAAETDLYTPL